MIANSERMYTYDAVNYYSYDPHGSVVSSGGKTYTYDAFGNQTTDNADDTNPFRYNGEYYDNETGYIYLRARYYDPSIGRFTTQDPIKDGLNWYVYCSNNPVMFVDPSGLAPGDLFAHPDLAALDFAMIYNEKSINHSNQDLRDAGSVVADGCEYGAYIYKVKTKDRVMYSYTEPVFRNNPEYIRLSVKLSDCVIPKGGTQCGTIHTHTWDGTETASRQDSNLFCKNEVNYLVTPRGSINKYNWKQKDEQSVLKDYKVYAYMGNNFFKESADKRQEYETKYAHTKEIYSGYNLLSNKLIWKLFLNAFPNKNPLEIVEAVCGTDSNYEALQQLQNK